MKLKYSWFNSPGVLIFFVFIFLPCVMTEFTIDADLAPKFFVSSLFILFYSAYLFFFVKAPFKSSGAIKSIFNVVLLILFWMTISWLFSLNKGEAFLELIRVAVLYCLFFILFYSFERSSASIKYVSRASSCSVLIFSAIAIYQAVYFLLFNPDKILTNIPNLITSSLANKNYFSEVLVLLLPLLFIGILNETKNWKRLFVISFLFNLLFLLYLQSSAAFVAIIVSVIFIFGLSKRYSVSFYNFHLSSISKTTFSLLIALTFALGVVFYVQTPVIKNFQNKIKQSEEYLFNPQLLQKTSAENNNSVFERLMLWRNSFKMIADNPVRGVGLNNWKLYNSSYGIGGTQIINSGYVNYEHPHNDYLLIWAEQGPIGILLYLSLFILILRMGIKKIERSDIETKRAIVLLLSGIIAFVTLSLFAYPRSRFYSMILLMVYFSLLISGNGDLNIKTYRIKRIALLIFLISSAGVVVSFYRIIGEIHTKELQIYQLQQNFARMIREANKAYSVFYPMDLTSTPLSWYKGMAYFDSGLRKDAIREYEKALEINPNHLRLLNDIATSYEQENQRSKAIYFYKKAITIAPFFIEANLNLCAAYFNQKNIDSSFYYIDNIEMNNFNSDFLGTYNRYLDVILYEKSLSILGSNKDSIIYKRLMPLIDNSDSLRRIYYMSKADNQPFAKYLMNYQITK